MASHGKGTWGKRGGIKDVGKGKLEVRAPQWWGVSWVMEGAVCGGSCGQGITCG